MGIEEIIQQNITNQNFLWSTFIGFSFGLYHGVMDAKEHNKQRKAHPIKIDNKTLEKQIKNNFKLRRKLGAYTGALGSGAYNFLTTSNPTTMFVGGVWSTFTFFACYELTFYTFASKNNYPSLTSSP
jgi:hypothetical protein